MDNVTLFSIGLAVCFLFAGGMLSHTIISQKLLSKEELQKKAHLKSPSEATTLQSSRGSQHKASPSQ